MKYLRQTLDILVRLNTNKTETMACWHCDSRTGLGNKWLVVTSNGVSFYFQYLTMAGSCGYKASFKKQTITYHPCQVSFHCWSAAVTASLPWNDLNIISDVETRPVGMEFLPIGRKIDTWQVLCFQMLRKPWMNTHINTSTTNLALIPTDHMVHTASAGIFIQVALYANCMHFSEVFGWKGSGGFGTSATPPVAQTPGQKPAKCYNCSKANIKSIDSSLLQLINLWGLRSVLLVSSARWCK